MPPTTTTTPATPMPPPTTVFPPTSRQPTVLPFPAAGGRGRPSTLPFPITGPLTPPVYLAGPTRKPAPSDVYITPTRLTHIVARHLTGGTGAQFAPWVTSQNLLPLAQEAVGAPDASWSVNSSNSWNVLDTIEDTPHPIGESGQRVLLVTIREDGFVITMRPYP